MDHRVIIDAHAHIFPQKLAEKATLSIGDFYGIPMAHPGSVDALLESGSKIGVSRYLVCSTATRAEQTHSINDFIAQQCELHPEFWGFGTLHPDLEDFDAEIGHIEELGLHGVKLHSDFQEFDIDDPRMMPVYKKLEGKFAVLFHMGDDRYDFSAPERLVRVVEHCPDLTVFAAHLGGYQRWEEANCLLRGSKNVYYDSSSSLFAMEPGRARELIRALGTDKVFFGSDFPMWDHEEELQRFLAVGLSQEENEQLFHLNFERVMNKLINFAAPVL